MHKYMYIYVLPIDRLLVEFQPALEELLDRDSQAGYAIAGDLVDVGIRAADISTFSLGVWQCNRNSNVSCSLSLSLFLSLSIYMYTSICFICVFVYIL